MELLARPRHGREGELARAALIGTTLLDGFSSGAGSPCTQRSYRQEVALLGARCLGRQLEPPEAGLGRLDVHVRIADAPEERDAEHRYELLERRIHGL